MSKYELKTKKTEVSVEEFLDAVADEKQRADSYAIIEMMQNITKQKPKMWGPSIIGFGSYHYKYDSGHEGDMCIAGFSPRKQNTTVYIISGFERYNELIKKLGKFKMGKSCLYIKKLEDIDKNVLEQLIKESIKYTKEKYAK